MASVTAFTTLQSPRTPNPYTIPPESVSVSPKATLYVKSCNDRLANNFKNPTLLLSNTTKTNKNLSSSRGIRRGLRTAEEDGLVTEDQQQQQHQQKQKQVAVPVPVSPSDALTMNFQAEGTMNEAAVPALTKALQQIEGISDLKVQVLEGIATVEVVKQTTVEATGVASGLVELIQGLGFKLQTLNLSFDNAEGVALA